MRVLLVVLKNIPYDLDLMFKQWIWQLSAAFYYAY